MISIKQAISDIVKNTLIQAKEYFAQIKDVVLSVNKVKPVNGDVTIDTVPFADNLTSDDTYQSNGDFIIRTTGGAISLSDGDAFIQRMMGNSVHQGYVAEELELEVIPIPRTAPASIVATLNESTFEAYVGTAGTYTLTYYEGEWSESPSLYGVTVTNTPIEGDNISIVWDGENDAVMTVNAAWREVPDPITATIDRDTFVQYVTESGTITLTYTTNWSADPTLYGVTVVGDPVGGDQIVITYVKEDRGTIVVATPTAIAATGWNLYNNLNGYAYAPKYSDTYGYRIGGAYTSIAFAETPTGNQSPITVEDGLFNIPDDGYIIVTGGDSTTYIYTTWGDWQSGFSGSLETYTETSISLSSIMTQYFPNGLMRVGDIRDEINLNTGSAISRIERLAYTPENIAAVAGRAHEDDENYIYVVRTSEVVNSISLEDKLTVSEHGTEFFRGTSVPVYTEILYGQNLKDVLRRGVVKTINGKHPDPVTGDIVIIEGGGSGSYGAYRLDATIPVSAWSSSSPYTATVTNEFIKATMDGSETWLDDESAMLGATTFTSQDGSLLVSTAVKPTATWGLHVTLALNGADVLAEMDENTKAIGKILPVITGTTNNSGYTINSGEYFEANGNLYKATATIGQTSSWSSSATLQTGTAINSLNSNLRLVKTSTRVFLNQLTWSATGSSYYYATATVPSHILATMKDFTSIPSGLPVIMFDYTPTQVEFLASSNTFSDTASIIVNTYEYGN